MTSSRSIASTSRLRALGVAVCAAVVLATGGAVSAGRRRVVVLDLEGPKGERFHDDLVRLIQKAHTVVPTDKWYGTAAKLDAGTLSEKNLKKVARKLKVDAIVEGKVEKRRDDYLLRLKVHEGKTGELVGSTIDTKATGPRIDGRAQRDLNDELLGAIGLVDTNHLSGDDDEDEDRPAKKARKPAADDEDEDRSAKKGKKPAVAEADDEDRPAKKAKKPVVEDDEDKPAKKAKKPAAEDDEDKPAKKAKKPAVADDEDRPAKKAKKPAVAAADEDKPARRFSKHTDDERGGDRTDGRAKKPAEDVADERPAGKARKPDPEAAAGDDKPASTDGDDDTPAKPKAVAARDDDGNAAEAEAEPARTIDLASSLSPAERALEAVVGLSVTMRRLTFNSVPLQAATPPGYKGSAVAGAMLDATVYPLAFGHQRTDQLKNLGIGLVYDRVFTLKSQDPMSKATYSTIESRFELAAVFRHAFGSGSTAPVVLGSLGYVRQSFNILGTLDIPDVKYSIVAPGAGLRLPVGAKLALAADAKFLLVLDAGQIQDRDKYGAATVLGVEATAGADYLITPRIFARAQVRFETIGYKFQGNGSQSNARDGNPMNQDVYGARDSYYGAVATVGYLY